MAQGQSSWKGEPATNVEIEVDIALLAAALIKNQDFIDAVALKVRKAQTRNARSTGNLFGQWAQGR